MIGLNDGAGARIQEGGSPCVIWRHLPPKRHVVGHRPPDFRHPARAQVVRCTRQR